MKKKGKSYSITDLGKNLVEIFPVKDLFDVDYTGKLEKSLSDIQKGQFTRKEYLTNIMNFIYQNVNLIKRDSNKNISTEVYTYNAKTKKYVKESSQVKKASSSVNKSQVKSDKSDSLGKCPVCQNDVIESDKGYLCINYNNCKFGIWKNDKYLEYYKKKPNKTMVKSILKNGQAKVKSLTSKQGKKFDALLKYNKKDNGYWGWTIELESDTSTSK